MPALSVVVMDMDGVKAINDTHGHHMGAFVIGAAGHVIGKLVEGGASRRASGATSSRPRLPGLGKEEAVRVAEEVRQAVVAHVYEKDGVRVHPGLSCGVATAPGDGAEGPDALFQAADQAMYRAKRAGKNRVST